MENKAGFFRGSHDLMMFGLGSFQTESRMDIDYVERCESHAGCLCDFKGDSRDP